MTKQQFFAENPTVAVAFSGGVDSAFLLYEAKRCGAEVIAYYVKTPFQPQFEYDDALRLAQALNVPITTLYLDVLQEENIVSNPHNRCYFCKQKIFTAILEQAKKDGFPLVIDGTNASDDPTCRPGMQALKELGVRSPLREWGLTKEDIRKLSREANLFTHDKPAYACLATRIPTGMPITKALLNKTERSEEFLKKLGLSDFRVRILGDCAKLQLKSSQFPLLLQHRDTILRELKKDYKEVLLDLEVRE